MGEALIEHAEHDIDRDQRRDDQDLLGRRALAEHLHVAGEIGPQRIGQVHLRDCLHDGVRGRLDAHVGGEIPGDGHGRVLALVVDP